jgi:hypothetical protein
LEQIQRPTKVSPEGEFSVQGQQGQEGKMEAAPISPQDSAAAQKIQEDAKALLNELLSKKDDAFFKKSESVKQAHEFAPEVVGRISKLSSDYKALSRSAQQRLLTPIQNEAFAILLLEGWNDFVKELKTGSVFDAGKILRSALDRKPSQILPAYKPLWDAASSWEDAYLNDEPKYQGHVKKAKDLAEKLMSADAIKEFQAAYDIIPNASIPLQIQKVREQSLGL